MNAVLNAIVTQENTGYSALNPETGIASQGETVESALANLREALELYFEELNDQNALSSLSRQHSFLTTITL